jgi:3-methylfumaryl-CoA hydratase
MPPVNLQDWVGRTWTAQDELSPRLVESFNATFDRPAAAGNIAPLGIHWCLSPDIASQSALGPDGHPARGEFLPPIDLPRRMWAGGALTFHDDLRAGDQITRHSRIVSVEEKHGRSGALCFVAVTHEMISPRGLSISERQDIVYRAASAGPSAIAPPPVSSAPPQWRRECRADAVQLFRYSALTFNSHRIHYDRDYATQIEHYPGLVVHGPLQATLLLQFAAECAQAAPKQFNYRGLSPLTDGENFSLNARPVDDGIELWAETAGGRPTMQAKAVF